MTARVAVVGGGWAGLAAAAHLSAHGIPVSLFEAARQLGGRARRVPFDQDGVDNGQHLLLGAYRETLQLLHLIGVEAERVLYRMPLSLPMRGTDGEQINLRVSRLPAPLHMAVGLLRTRGLTPGERLAALRFGLWLQRKGHALAHDVCVTDLMHALRQPPRLIRALWGPLCLAALNTPPQQASARVFLRVLHDAFRHRREDSDLLFTVADLGALLPEPALHYVETHGGSVRLGQRVERLWVEDGRTKGIETGGERQDFDHVVIATAAPAAARLLGPHSALADTASDIARLHHQPVCTVYLQYADPAVRLPEPMIGILDGTAQWVFDRRINGQPGLLAAVMSGVGPHLELDNASLGARVSAELAALFPHWPPPRKTLIIREKRGTFSCDLESQGLRPGIATAVPGCWLAGDYTDTGYPGTLEGAVRSGVECARAILARSNPAANQAAPRATTRRGFAQTH